MLGRYSAKKRAAFAVRLYCLFCVVCNSAFTNDIDLDLTGIVHLGFDLLSDLSCNKNHLVIVDDLRLNHDPDLASCLNSKALLDSLIGVADLLKLLESLDVAFIVFASCSRSCRRDSVSSLNNAGNDSSWLDIVVVSLDRMDNDRAFVVLLTNVNAYLNV